jgi:hypothetical protein
MDSSSLGDHEVLIAMKLKQPGKNMRDAKKNYDKPTFRFNNFFNFPTFDVEVGDISPNSCAHAQKKSHNI